MVRLDHLSTTTSDSNFYWHVNMREKHLRCVGSFPIPYDADLLTTLDGEDCFDVGEVM